MHIAQIDFEQLLTQNLRTVSKTSQSVYHDLHKKGFGSWLKDQPSHCPAILFQISELNRLDLWANPCLDIPDNVDSVHYELLRNLKSFLTSKKSDAQVVKLNGKGYYSVEIYCYRWGARILVVENMGGSYFEADEMRNSINIQNDFAYMLYELMHRYKLICIAGPRRGKMFFPESNPCSLKENGMEIVPLSDYHETRQERYLRQFAKRHQLTVAQWLRFHLMAKLAQAANLPCNYESLIAKIKT